MSGDLVNHKKWSWDKIDARNGKSVMELVRKSILRASGCGRTRRVNWVYFSETWLKILNNLAWLKVGYNKITGLHFMSGRTEMGYEVG